MLVQYCISSVVHRWIYYPVHLEFIISNFNIHKSVYEITLNKNTQKIQKPRREGVNDYRVEI